MGWSNKYKKSINCNNPKGFSQKAHCAGKKKRNERVMKLSEFKEAVTKVLRERSINAISKLQQKNVENIAKALEFYKKNKHTDKREPFIKLLKKLGKEKESLAKELDMKVSGMYKNAEYKGESVNEAKLNHHRITGNSIEFYVKDKGKNLVLRFKDKRDFDKLKLDLDNPKDLQKILAKRPNKMSISMGESVNEGASSEEKRIAMLAVKKQAKYRNVSLSQAIQDQINALEELKRQYKGK
jgi:hypothetical protein